MTPDEVVQKLREIRYAPPRLTLTEIARQAGLSRQTVYDTIRGRTEARSVDAIARVLDAASGNVAYPTHRDPR